MAATRYAKRFAALQARLAEAEAALDASVAALKTCGHQGITWAFLAADGKRVTELRQQIANASRGRRP